MLPSDAIELIKRFEGYLERVNEGTDDVKPYRDPIGIPTIGWGAIGYEDGTRVKMSDNQISIERATELLHWELARVVEPAIDRYVRTQLHPHMRGALASFAFNLGTGNLRRSTLLKRINAQRWADVPKEFAKWRLAGGKPLRGLVRRRKAEAEMFMWGVGRLYDGWQPVSLSPKVRHATKRRKKPRLSRRSVRSLVPKWWKTFVAAGRDYHNQSQ